MYAFISAQQYLKGKKSEFLEKIISQKCILVSRDNVHKCIFPIIIIKACGMNYFDTSGFNKLGLLGLHKKLSVNSPKKIVIKNVLHFKRPIPRRFQEEKKLHEIVTLVDFFIAYT